jgi:CheY-like chemotaxis protein
MEPATIVLADDEPDLRMLYAEVLRRDGYVVSEAGDGAEALDLVASHMPDLLLLDVWMPRVNGFEVIDRLRSDPRASELKVVMLSNICDADALLEGYSFGVYDYWIKGLSLDELRGRVARLVPLPRSEAVSDPV